jgi:hypothetical protein
LSGAGGDCGWSMMLAMAASALSVGSLWLKVLVLRTGQAKAVAQALSFTIE